MKTIPEIFTYERLLRAFAECERGQLWKGSVIDFRMNYAENLMRLAAELAAGKYAPSPDRISYINERGKTRRIHSQHIRDRIVHKVINQDILIPTFHKSMIRQNTASQKGKGVDFAMRTLHCHLNRAYRKWGTDFYILAIDIKSYFGSIPHWYIEQLLREKLKDEEIIRLCMLSVCGEEEEKGIGLGSEMNQTYALLCLNEYDHIIKEKFRIREYARYMDDFYIMHNDKEYLQELKAFTIRYLARLGMEINEKKTQIFPIKNGMKFLGFRWRMTKSGHVIKEPKRQTVARNKRKLRKLQRLMREGRLDLREAERCYKSMRGNLMRSNSRRTTASMDAYFKRLFAKGGDGDGREGACTDAKQTVHGVQEAGD